MGSFKDARIEEMARVPWLDNDHAQAYVGTLGEQQDIELRRAKDAALMSMGPFDCPDDGLDAIGRDFGLPRFSIAEANGTAPNPITGEGGSGYRGRLCKAWITWQRAGSKGAIIASLQAWGIPDVAVYEAHELKFLPQNPEHEDPPWRSAFIVVLGPDFGGTNIGPLIAPFECYQTTGGSTATIEQMRQIVGQCLFWKSAHSYLVAIVLRLSPDTIISGINSTAPFTPPDEPPLYCWVDIGKIIGANVINAPFVPAGYWFRDEWFAA